MRRAGHENRGGRSVGAADAGENLVRGSLKMLLLLGAVGALIVLVARHGGEVTGLGDRDLASLVYNVGFLALVGGAVLRIFRDRLGEAIQAVLLWAVVALALIVAYTYRFDLKDAGDRVMAELMPGRAQAAAVTLDRIAVGGIVERSVPALIAQPGQLKTSLLGMSFLSRLQGWEVRGDKVMMRAAP